MSVDRHILNLRAEMDYDEKRERDKELYEVKTVDEETGIIITSTDFTKRIHLIEGLEDRSKGFIGKPYKGRKPGER